MTSRLGHKSKSSASKKKSPGTSRSNTPTHSQSIMGGEKNQEEQPSIDDVLTGEDIEKLRIKEEDLEKLHPPPRFNISKESQGRTQRIAVLKEISDETLEKRPSQKSVAVLYPLPPGVKPTKTKLLGSPKPGPRFDEDDVFVSHSILGSVDDYISSQAAKKKVSTVTAVSQIPPIVLPDIPKKIPEKPNKFSSPKETNALTNWDRRMKERKKLQENITKRIKTSSQLTMNHGDSYRTIQEERAIIDRAIPVIDKGKGFYVGSEFWRPQITIGNDTTGIRTTLTRTEKGYPLDIVYIKTPNSIKRDKGIPIHNMGDPQPVDHQPWEKTEYLKTRKNELVDAITDLDLIRPQDMSTFQVIGHTPRHSQQVSIPQLPSSSPLYHSDSLDSLGEDTLSDDEEDDGEIREDEDSLLECTSILDLHPDVIVPPVFGPALQLNDQLLKWEGEAGERREDVGDDDIGTRVLFEAGIQESVSSHLLLVNPGTAAVYFNWKRVSRPNPLGTVLAGKTQRFYFDTRGGVLSPGQSLSIPFTFKSPNAGIYTETWSIETSPLLCGGRNIRVTLKGVAFQQDIYKTKREQIERDLTHKMAVTTAKRLVDKMVDSIHTPPRVQSPLPISVPEETKFLSRNKGVYYDYNTVQLLKKLYTDVLQPSTEHTELSENGGKTEGKKVEDKTKKEKGSKDKGKPGKMGVKEEVAKEVPTINVTPTVEIDIPPWDLSLDTLQKLILGIEDDDKREEKLTKLNEAIESLSLPPPEIQGATNYITIYSLLCEAIDQIAGTGEHLRKVMGLPLKDMGLTKDETASEVEPQVPSQPDSPAHGGKKDLGKKGGKGKETAKEKEKRPPSKKGNVPRKGSVKTGAKTLSKTSSPEPDQSTTGSKENTTVSKVPDVDPVLNEKYKQNLYSMVYFILGSTIEQMEGLINL